MSVLPVKARYEIADRLKLRLLAGEVPTGPRGLTMLCDHMIRTSGHDSESDPIPWSTVIMVARMARKRHVAAVARFDRGAVDFAAQLQA